MSMPEMMTPVAIRGATPLSPHNCFSVNLAEFAPYNRLIHYRDAFELKLLLNVGGARRIVGNSAWQLSGTELVLIGPGLDHGWLFNHCSSAGIKELTVHFHKDLLTGPFLNKAPLTRVREMLDKAGHGLLFSDCSAENIRPRLLDLLQKKQFEAVLELLQILHQQSVAHDARTLSEQRLQKEWQQSKNKRFEKIIEFLRTHYTREIRLTELAGMTDESFCKLFKVKTGKTFLNALNGIRVAHVSRILVETRQRIKDIAIQFGFNNISNFKRVFKLQNNCTPKHIREAYSFTKHFPRSSTFIV